jgi:hypothetical protein
VRRVAILTTRVAVREERMRFVVTIRAPTIRDRGRCMRSMAAETVLRIAGRQLRVCVVARCVAGEARARLKCDWIVGAVTRAARLARVDIDCVQLALRQCMAAHAASSVVCSSRTEVVTAGAVRRVERIADVSSFLTLDPKSGPRSLEPAHAVAHYSVFRVAARTHVHARRLETPFRLVTLLTRESLLRDVRDVPGCIAHLVP